MLGEDSGLPMFSRYRRFDKTMTLKSSRPIQVSFRFFESVLPSCNIVSILVLL